jgi:queuosine precursor transporter
MAEADGNGGEPARERKAVSTVPPAPAAGYSTWFVVIVALFVTTLITANIAAVKIITILGNNVTGGIVIFPLAYLFGDVLTEVYGYSQARRVIWLGFLCNLIVVLTLVLVQHLPAAPFWNGQSAYDRILGYVPRLVTASFTAYVIGEFANSFILAKMKIATDGRWLWSRTIGSTLVGQGLDSAIFMTIAFAGTVSSGTLGNLILVQWVLKTIYEVAATPFTYGLVNFLKRIEGLDVFDRHTNFNPLLVAE